MNRRKFDIQLTMSSHQHISQTTLLKMLFVKRPLVMESLATHVSNHTVSVVPNNTSAKLQLAMSPIATHQSNNQHVIPSMISFKPQLTVSFPATHHLNHNVQCYPRQHIRQITTLPIQTGHLPTSGHLDSSGRCLVQGSQRDLCRIHSDQISYFRPLLAPAAQRQRDD